MNSRHKVQKLRSHQSFPDRKEHSKVSLLNTVWKLYTKDHQAGTPLSRLLWVLKSDGISAAPFSRDLPLAEVNLLAQENMPNRAA